MKCSKIGFLRCINILGALERSNCIIFYPLFWMLFSFRSHVDLMIAKINLGEYILSHEVGQIDNKDGEYEGIVNSSLVHNYAFDTLSPRSIFYK